MRSKSWRLKISRFSTLALSALVLIRVLMAAGQLAFETASVKTADGCRFQNSVDPAMVTLNGDPLAALLTEAFKVDREQVIGPSWLDTDCVTVNAKMPEGATRDRLPEMLRTLLLERFNLATHMETRQRSGYALVLDKNGPKCKKADTKDAGEHAGQVTFGFGDRPRIKGAMTMAKFAQRLSRTLQSPVQDLTGLDGTYDIDLAWVPDRVAFSAQNETPHDPNPANSGASVSSPVENDIFTSLRNALGLRLERRKLPIEVVMIDHIDRVPTAN